MKANILPPPLQRGDTIGVFCPAGPPKNLTFVKKGVELLNAAGFQTRFAGVCEIRAGEYLAASDTERARSLHQLWEDGDVKAIMPVRGGYGCLRLLPHVDEALLKSRCKWLVGFSDLTLLLNYLAGTLGYVCLHGPMLASLSRCRQEDREALFSWLTGAPPIKQRLQHVEILRGGSGRGPLAGGNLATLVHCLGTPWENSWDGCILLLEDTGEYLYRIDRMLTQLQLAGRFDHLAGLLLGDFDTGADNKAANQGLQEQVWQRVLEIMPPGFPIWANAPVGHLGRNIPLPLGMTVTMDSASGRLLW